jgi:hypothetical protein
VPGLARRVEQIAWACHNDRPPLTGVHIDGKRLVACDSYTVALMPCTVPVDTPVTAPLGTLSAVLRNIDDVRLRATETRLEIMPDDDTQLTALVYGLPYPEVDRIINQVKVTYDVGFDRRAMIEVIKRMQVIVKSERHPRLDLVFNADTIDLDMSLQSVGEIKETIDCQHGPIDPISFTFDPGKLLDAIQGGSRDLMQFGISENTLHPTRLHDEGDFDSWVMPMAPMGGQA